MIAKCAGVDPQVVFQNIFSVAAFNEMQQMTATKEIVDLMKKDRTIKLVVIHNLTRFIETSKKPSEARKSLKQIIGSLKSVASENNIALVVSCSAIRTHRGRIPKPIGGTYLRHETNVVVLLQTLKRRIMSPVKITLVKHPYKKTPQSIILHVPKDGVTFMGRITPSFRQQFHKVIEELRRSSGFQNRLINLEHKKAFDLLLKEAWSAENAAMSTSGIPCVTDILNLMANVHNKKCTETNMKHIEYNKKCIEKLKGKLRELEYILEKRNRMK
jgi:hypothetical protein